MKVINLQITLDIPAAKLGNKATEKMGNKATEKIVRKIAPKDISTNFTNPTTKNGDGTIAVHAGLSYAARLLGITHGRMRAMADRRTALDKRIAAIKVVKRKPRRRFIVTLKPSY